MTEIYDLRLLLEDKTQFHDLVGESVGMQLVYKQIRDVALVDTTVLVAGETGTGKELVVRVVAATHRDLNDEVAAGRFRADLLYRICVAQLRLPPLRERRQDIPLLASWFLSQFRAAQDKGVQDISHESMQALLSYTWPGNVRELKSAIESGVIRCRGPVLQPADLPTHIATVPITRKLSAPTGDEPAEDKRRRISEALDRANGNRAAAARLLGISRATLYRAANAEGLTALMYAATGGWPETAEALLAAGADINQRSRDGATALMNASLWGHARVVALLLESGADVTVHDSDGWTALKFATEQDHQSVCRVIRIAGAGN